MAGEARDLIRSAVVDDYDRTDHAVEALGPTRAQAVIAATFTLAATRRFGQLPDLGEVSRYVAELRSRYGDRGREIKPMVAEALIRGALGEADLLEGLPEDDVIPTEIAVAFAIVKDLDLSEEQLDAFVLEAEKLAEHWR